MIRFASCVTLLFSVLLASACGGPTQQTTAPSTDPAPINDLRTRFQTAHNAGDAAAIAALFTDDATSMPDHHAAIDGKAAIQQHFQEIFAQYTTSISITPANTEVSGDFAHEHGQFSLTLTPKGGGNPITESGKYLVVLERQADGTWKIHHDMDNTDSGH